jgi:putative hydrolase of the HAD superfamily
LKPSVITFDGDHTLWDFTRVMRFALGKTLGLLQKRHPGPARLLTIAQMVEDRDRAEAELQGQTLVLAEIRQRAFEISLERIGLDDMDLAEELSTAYLKWRFSRVYLYRDVRPAFRRLATDYRIGLVSNGNTYPDSTGLGEFFEFAVFSEAHGVAKPDPRIFEITARQAGCPPEAMVHVGDSLENDVRCAQEAGVIAVWLNRGDDAQPRDIRPDASIRSLRELPGLLASLGREVVRERNGSSGPSRQS